MLECTKDRVRNLAELLRAPWIRPEDIGWYADRFGIKTFKIQGRQMPEQWVLNAVRSYLDGRFEGNLLDLISPTFPDWSSRYGKVNGIGEAAVERAHFARPSVAIDNQRLDDFVAGLKQRGGCSAARGCDTCHFCDDEAPGLIEVADPAQLAGYGAVTRRLLDGVLDTRPA
jgi:collagenase-like PrtC family protease